jgi:putative component of toxin-antitoxin plasmid stabilization module
MYAIKRTQEFDVWFSSIWDGSTLHRLVARMRKAQLGNLGDVKSVGGGEKSTQVADIARAVKLAARIEE